ncbi:MAG: hypothetical protein WA175_04770 [Candidatus Acidiferrales bacterium]
MPHRSMATGILAGALAALLLPGYALARAPQDALQHKDYLTDAEADKIRDAVLPGPRIKLYLSFAEDRLKKFEYEVNRSVPDAREDELLNGLLNAYVGSVDDGADQIEVAQDKQVDIRAELKLIVSKDNGFLVTLEKYDANGPGLAMYKDTLEDAIQGTKDALEDAQDALKGGQTAPVRRKQ